MKWLKKVAATPLTTIAKVIDNLNEQTNDRTNAPSIHAVREAVNNNWLNIYPVGSIYMNTTNVNPSTLFGGTWTQIKDRFLLSAGDTYENGSTGGSATHTPSGTVEGHKLTYEEAALAHSHHTLGIGRTAYKLLQYVNGNVQDGNIYSIDTVSEGVGLVEGKDNIATQTDSFGWEENDIQPHNHAFTGASQNTLPPYLTVYVWQRVA